MSRFLLKLFIFLSPLLVIAGIYAYYDPFKVLYHYDAYFSPRNRSWFDLDWDYVSTQTLLQQHDKYNYDSYIFGSSRSDNYQVKEWSKHIGSSRCYHFGANYESIYGIERKMQLLQNKHYPVSNALVIVDHELLAVAQNGNGHLQIKHPVLSGQSGLKFQSVFFTDFLDKSFLFPYLGLVFSGKAHQDDGPFTRLEFTYDIGSNETASYRTDSLIKTDSLGYYAGNSRIFYQRDAVQHYSKPVIGAAQLKLLTHIKQMFAEDGTSYKIVISPLYDQQKLAPQDLRLLQDIFGLANVFDFSGINDITSNKASYYESSHYRPQVCTHIMDQVYGPVPVAVKGAPIPELVWAGDIYTQYLGTL